MRYDWKESVPFAEGTSEFYDEIDRRFFSNVQEFMPCKTAPFDALIPYDRLPTMDVLEIGVGNGSHAQLLAQHAKSFTGIDLTDYAVTSTTSRMRVRGLKNATIRQMDAEQLDFPDASFDLIWTWGVIHHSSDTPRILGEMARVLRQGGTAITMVYNRGLWNYYIVGGFFWGILAGDLFRTGSLSEVVQRHTDGALARYYNAREWRDLASRFFTVREIRFYGSKAEMFPLPPGRIKRTLMSLTPNAATRFCTNRLGQGSFLISILDRNRA